MTIRVEINVKDMELSERLRDYTVTKVGKLDRYLDTLEEAKVDLTNAKSARSAQDRQVAQVTVIGKGVLLRAEDRTEDMFASVDLVIDKLHRQIDRYKGRRWKARGDGRSAAEVAPDVPDIGLDEVEREIRIVRRKRHLLLPMDEQEAIEQMDLLGHEDFFVFLNANNNAVNILYRRRDGTLGMIETEVA